MRDKTILKAFKKEINLKTKIIPSNKSYSRKKKHQQLNPEDIRDEAFISFNFDKVISEEERKNILRTLASEPSVFECSLSSSMTSLTLFDCVELKDKCHFTVELQEQSIVFGFIDTTNVKSIAILSSFISKFYAQFQIMLINE